MKINQRSILIFSMSMLIGIVVAYFFVDRPLCEWVYYHQIPSHIVFLQSIVEWPPVVTALSPLLLLISPLIRPGKARDTLILVCLTVLFCFVLKNELKWVFSRYWPLTWIHNNPSWIGNHAYGFQWFKGAVFAGSDITGSFPSGHTAIAFATLVPIGLMYRRALILCITLACLEGLAMITFDYHFLSDVLAGAWLGVICSIILKKIESQAHCRSTVS